MGRTAQASHLWWSGEKPCHKGDGASSSTSHCSFLTSAHRLANEEHPAIPDCRTIHEKNLAKSTPHGRWRRITLPY